MHDSAAYHVKECHHPFAITPDDDDPQPTMRGFWSNIDGTVTLCGSGDDDEDVEIVTTAGQYVPIAARFIRSTGTDHAAGELIGFP